MSAAGEEAGSLWDAQLGQLKCGKWTFLSKPVNRKQRQPQGQVNAAPFHSRPFYHTWWPGAGSRAHA